MLYTKIVLVLSSAVFLFVAFWFGSANVAEVNSREARTKEFLAEGYCAWVASSSDLQLPLSIDLDSEFQDLSCSCLLDEDAHNFFVAAGKCALEVRDGSEAALQINFEDGYGSVRSDLVPTFTSCVKSVVEDDLFSQQLFLASMKIRERRISCQKLADAESAERQRVEASERAQLALVELEVSAAQRVSEYRKLVAAGLPRPFGIDFLDREGMIVAERTIDRFRSLSVPKRRLMFLTAFEVASARATSVRLGDQGAVERLIATIDRALGISEGLDIDEARQELAALRLAFETSSLESSAGRASLSAATAAFRSYSMAQRERSLRYVEPDTDADPVLLFALVEMMHPRVSTL